MTKKVKDFVYTGGVHSHIMGTVAKLDPSTCSFSVTEYGRITDWHQCSRKIVDEIGGFGFCKTHAAKVRSELGVDVAKNVRFAASFDRVPNLAELDVVSETKFIINIKSTKDIMGNSYGLYNGSLRKDSSHIRKYKFFDNKNDAIQYLIFESEKNVRWCQTELDRAEHTHKELLEAWYK